MDKMGRVPVETLQPVERRGWVVAQIGAGEWDLRREGMVDLCSRSGRVRLRYAGFGEAGGHRLLTLVPVEGERASVRQIVATLGGSRPDDAFLERVPVHADAAPALLSAPDRG